MHSPSDDSQKELSSITRGFTGPNIITTTRLVRGIQHQQQHKLNPERCYTPTEITRMLRKPSLNAQDVMF